jgi:hypothetical protein
MNLFVSSLNMFTIRIYQRPVIAQRGMKKMNSQTVENKQSDEADCANGSLGQCVKNSCSKLEQRIQRQPQSTMLMSLGAGVGVGILIGTMLGGSRSNSRNWFERETAERLGQRLMSQMGDLLPNSITDRFSG